MNNSPLSPQAAAKLLIERRRARTSLIDFVRYTKSDYVVDWVHEELAAKLDQFLADVEAKKSPRLMVFMPPRHGKSELASRRFPAYALGKNPNLTFIATSYSADLAVSISRDVQKVIDSDTYASLFKARLGRMGEPEKKTADEWEIVGGSGAYKCAGVGGGITGRGGDILLIDDPVKDFAEANSQTYREAVWNWYLSTLRTRAAPGAGILLIITRWHVDDVAGRLLVEADKGGEKWDVVDFPAIAEADEKHRKAGEALSPKRFDLNALLAIKRSVGNYVWSALYQQSPIPSDGAVFLRKHWQFYKVLPELDTVVISVDCAFKGLSNSDYVALQAWGIKGANKYLLHRVREQIGFAATVAAVRAMKAKFPQAIAVLIEDKANGPAVIETLKNEIAGVVPVEPFGGKLARANAAQPEQEAGNLFLPDPSIEPRIEDFLHEASTFPGGKHDDEIDAMTQFVNWWRARSNMSHSGLFQYYREEAARAADSNSSASSDSPQAFMQAFS